MSKASGRMTAGRAKAALAVLVVMLVAIQFAGVALAHYYGDRLNGEGSSYVQWNNYLANPPDILVMGDSRAREDVNVDAIQAALSTELGRRVVVGKLGFDSAQPRNLLAVMYRVAHLSQRPKLVLYSLSEYMFSNSYSFDPTYDFWNMEFPVDLGYLQLVYNIDAGNQNRLLGGFVNPVDANLRLLETGAPCTVHDAKHFLAVHTPMHLEGAIEPLSYCDTPPGFANLTMTEGSANVGFEQYRQIFANHWSFSETQASYVRQAAGMAKDAGMRLAFFVSPEYRIDALNPAAYADFEQRTTSLVFGLGSHLYDFHLEYQDSPGLWADPAHLNRLGTDAFVPKLVAMIEAELASG